jgi:Outer membrane protein beta-barrel domain
MRPICKTTITCLLVIVAFPTFLNAQDEYGEDSKLNTNMAIPLSVPLNPLAKSVNFGLGTTIGAGYNLSRRNAIVAEFMWNRLFVSSQTLAPLRLALHTHDLNGHGNLYAFTANYRYELSGHSLGTYFIAGGGFYYRNANLSQHVVAGTATTCTREWLFWGFTCTSGTVSTDQTLASASSGTLGANGGIGFTVKVGEPRYRLYLEARYHYAPTTRLNTQIIPITMGIRF